MFFFCFLFCGWNPNSIVIINSVTYWKRSRHWQRQLRMPLESLKLTRKMNFFSLITQRLYIVFVTYILQKTLWIPPSENCRSIIKRIFISFPAIFFTNKLMNKLTVKDSILVRHYWLLPLEMCFEYKKDVGWLQGRFS